MPSRSRKQKSIRNNEPGCFISRGQRFKKNNDHELRNHSCPHFFLLLFIIIWENVFAVAPLENHFRLNESRLKGPNLINVKLDYDRFGKVSRVKNAFSAEIFHGTGFRIPFPRIRRIPCFAFKKIVCYCDLCFFAFFCPSDLVIKI